jgi:uncharacterized RmlC-like cupin family protein
LQWKKLKNNHRASFTITCVDASNDKNVTHDANLNTINIVCTSTQGIQHSTYFKSSKTLAGHTVINWNTVFYNPQTTELKKKSKHTHTHTHSSRIIIILCGKHHPYYAVHLEYYAVSVATFHTQ